MNLLKKRKQLNHLHLKPFLKRLQSQNPKAWCLALLENKLNEINDSLRKLIKWSDSLNIKPHEKGPSFQISEIINNEILTSLMSSLQRDYLQQERRLIQNRITKVLFKLWICAQHEHQIQRLSFLHWHKNLDFQHRDWRHKWRPINCSIWIRARIRNDWKYL